METYEFYCLCGWSATGAMNPEAQQRHDEWRETQPQCAVAGCSGMPNPHRQYNAENMCGECWQRLQGWRDSRRSTYPPFYQTNDGRWTPHPWAGRRSAVSLMRRGDDKAQMQPPKQVGLAIDALIALAERMSDDGR